KVRDAYARATDPAEKKRIATEAQVLNTKVVTHIPLGEWYGVGAVRANVTLLNPLPPVTVFWGVEKNSGRYPSATAQPIRSRIWPDRARVAGARHAVRLDHAHGRAVGRWLSGPWRVTIRERTSRGQVPRASS